MRDATASSRGRARAHRGARRSPRSIVTDTDPAARTACDDPRITVLSVAPLFGEAIKRIHRGESVGALFSSEVQLVEEMTFWDEAAEDEAPAEPEPFPVSAD